MKKKTVRLLLVAGLLFACWLQYPVGLHIHEAVPGVKATCSEIGLTEGKKCKLCGKVTVLQQVIPATGLHVYDNDFDKSCNECSQVREVSSKFAFVNHRVVLRDEQKNHKNWKVTVYNLGEQTVEDPADEAKLQVIDSAAKTYEGISEINQILLIDAGNYVALLKYNVGDTVEIKVPLAFTITDEPKIFIDEHNKITVVDKSGSDKKTTLTVCYLGEVEAAQTADKAAVEKTAARVEVYTDIASMNETVITQGGNYVFYLEYDAEDGTKQTVTLAEKLKSCASLRVDDENKLVATCDDKTITNFRAVIYYLGDQTVTDIYDQTELEHLDSDPAAYWELKRINGVQLSKPGNYVVHLHYNKETGAKETIAIEVTI